MTPEDTYVTIKRLMDAIEQQRRNFDELAAVNQKQREQIAERDAIIARWHAAFDQAKGHLTNMGETFIATLERLKLADTEIQ